MKSNKNMYTIIIIGLLIVLFLINNYAGATNDITTFDNYQRLPDKPDNIDNYIIKNVTLTEEIIDNETGRESHEQQQHADEYSWHEGRWAPYGAHGMRHQGSKGGHYIYYYFEIGENAKQQVVDGSLKIGVEFCSWSCWPWIGGPDLWVYKYSTNSWVRIKQSMGNQDELQWKWYTPSNSINWISNWGGVYFCVYACNDDDVVLDDVGVRWQTQDYDITFYTSPTSGSSIIFDGTAYHNNDYDSKSAGGYYTEALPPSGYIFDHWSVTGGISVANINSAMTTTTIESPGGSLKAWFSTQPNMIDFYVNPISGGKITFNGNDYYNGGHCSIADGTYSLVATASSNYQFSSWSITGSGNSIANLNSATTTATINSNGAITANYITTPTYPVTIYISPPAGGSVTFAGVTYSNGDTIQKYAGTYTLVASPSSSYYIFKKWTKTGGITIANIYSQSTTATVSSPGGTITANFDTNNNPPTAYIDSISPNPANQGQTIYFSGHGSDPDPGGYITGYQWRSSIAGILSTQSSFSTNTLSSGTHTIYFKVKDNEDLWSTEVSQTLSIITQEADLTVISITIPDHPFDTREVNIIGTIKNVGNLASPSFSCALYVDGETTPLTTTTVNGINPGASRDAQFSDIQLSPGNHTIKIWADYNNNVPEDNENNNDMEQYNIWIKAFYLTVSLNWDADQSFVNELHEAFKSASNYLYDLTDGYFCYDSVKIEENSTNWTTADIQIQESYYQWPQAHVGGIANSGMHIFLGQKWYVDLGGGIDNIQIEDWSDQDGFRTIDHEFGHYGLWLRDEYYRASQNRFANCTGGNIAGDDSGAWSAMCSQYNSTEFCNPSNHRTGNGLPAHSCWTTFNNHYSFAPVPTAVNPGPNDNVGQYMEFIGLAPSTNPPWGNTDVNWLRYGPGYPQPSQQVLATINVIDPNGIALITMYYRVDNGANISVNMEFQGNNNYSGYIPGQQIGSHVQFHFMIQDELGHEFKYPVERPFEYIVQGSVNQPPNVPIDPNPENGATHVSTEAILSVFVSDPNGDDLKVYFYNASNDQLIGYVNSSSNSKVFLPWSGLQTEHEYRWYTIVNDSQYENRSETWVFSTGAGINNPPESPMLNENPSWWLPGVEYQFWTTTTDPEGDDLEYYIEWGDLTNTGWIGPYHSGEDVYVNKTWYAEAAYKIKIKARDIYGAESDWSELTINISQITTTKAFLGGFVTNKRTVGNYYYFRVEGIVIHAKLKPIFVEILTTDRELVISQDYKLGVIIDLQTYVIVGFFDTYVIPESTSNYRNLMPYSKQNHLLQQLFITKHNKDRQYNRPGGIT